MPGYSLLAKVDQIVTREINLLIEADTKEEAEKTAREVLQDFPEPVPYNPMVHRVRTSKAKYWIPKSIEFSEVREATPDEAA